MKKKYKVIITVIVILVLIAAGALTARRMIINYLFDKAYNSIMNSGIEAEITDAGSLAGGEKIVGEDGKTYELASETETETEEIKGEDGKIYVVKKSSGVTGKGTDSAAKPRVKRISELTTEEMSDIQKMVSSADKAAVVEICVSVATAEDKREIKDMIEAGKIDYGRVKEILSSRLTAEQKTQIYSYYEKYAKIYFGVE